LPEGAGAERVFSDGDQDTGIREDPGSVNTGGEWIEEAFSSNRFIERTSEI
jgi:hypothetical protein